jgi:redox-sensitive bicupin YhaK (pirin superfamily)
MEIVTYILSGRLEHRDSLGNGGVLTAGELQHMTAGRFAPAEMAGTLRLVASPDGAEGSLSIHQDARLHLARLAAGGAVQHSIAPGRHAWLQVLRGSVAANANDLIAVDGAAISEPGLLKLVSHDSAEVMLFDLG